MTMGFPTFVLLSQFPVQVHVPGTPYLVQIAYFSLVSVRLKILPESSPGGKWWHGVDLLGQRVFRTLVFYAALLVIVRLMGKREMDSLSPFDLVVAVMIGEMAVISIEDLDISVWEILIPMLSLAGAELLISFLMLKSDRLRHLIDGAPTLLIKDGVILEKNMRSIRYNLTDLLAQLRLAGYPNADDIEVAVLETNGKLSVVPKSQKRAVTPEDLGLPTRYEGLLVPLIKDGIVMHRNLKEIGLSEDWLLYQLRERNIQSLDDVFLATIDSDGELFIQTRTNQGGDLPP